MPFREAHHITGRIVAAAEAKGVTLDALPLAAMQAVDARITKDVFAVLSPESSVKSRHELWGNRATERAQNGQGLDKAIGKAIGKGLELPGRP